MTQAAHSCAESDDFTPTIGSWLGPACGLDSALLGDYICCNIAGPSVGACSACLLTAVAVLRLQCGLERADDGPVSRRADLPQGVRPRAVDRQCVHGAPGSAR